MRLKPRDTKFFELFSVAGENIATATTVLREFVTAPIEERPELARRMREVEHAGDDATHAIVEQLDRAFVTPFDREDIYRLAVRLDDVVDYMDAAVDLTTLYETEALPKNVTPMVEVLDKCAKLTAA